jgi:hypothetical protein
MSEQPHNGRINTAFLLERYWAGVSPETFAAAVHRLDDAAEQMRREGTDVRHLGSVLVGAEEVVLCVLAAPTAKVAGEAGDRALMPFNRIVDVLSVDGEAHLGRVISGDEGGRE